MVTSGTTLPNAPVAVNVQEAGLLDWIKDHVIDPVASIFNPFEWLAKAEHTFTNGVVSAIAKLLQVNNTPGDNDITQYLYGNALGLTPLIITGVIIVLLIVAQFMQHKIATLGQALAVAVVLSILTPLWFEICQNVIQGGNQLAKAANWYHGGRNALSIPDFTSVLGGIVGFTSILILGMILVLIVFTYPLLGLFAETVGLPALALSSAGDRANKWFGRAVGLGFVSLFAGRPVAIAWLNLGKAVADHGPLGNVSSGQLLYLNAALILAIISQFALLKGANRVYARASGQVRSNVRGKVEATFRQNQQVQINSVRNAHANTMQSAATVPKQRSSGTVKTAATSMALSKAASMHPYVGAGIAITQTATQAHKKTQQRKHGGDKT